MCESHVCNFHKSNTSAVAQKKNAYNFQTDGIYIPHSPAIVYSNRRKWRTKRRDVITRAVASQLPACALIRDRQINRQVLDNESFIRRAAREQSNPPGRSNFIVIKGGGKLDSLRFRKAPSAPVRLAPLRRNQFNARNKR